MPSLPNRLIHEPVVGVGLRGTTLAAHLRLDRQVLVVFLRNLADSFTKELVDELRAWTEADPSFPDVVLIYKGTVRQGQRFTKRRWPGVPAIADHQGRLYDAAGVPRGGWREVFGLRTLVRAVRAASTGHFMGPPNGDVWTMPTLILARGDLELWRHVGEHAADHPVLDRLSRLPRLQLI